MVASPTACALVVEDDGSWQQILSEILSDVGLIVDVADSLEAAISILREKPHRLAVVDLSLGGSDHRNQDGLQVLDALYRHDPSCIALLVTGFATVEIAVSALTEYGAFTCLRKETFNRAEFRSLVSRALASPLPSLSNLTSREREVLTLLSQGMTNKEIAEALVITTNTVKRHLKSIFEKMDVHTRTAATARAIGDKAQ